MVLSVSIEIDWQGNFHTHPSPSLPRRCIILKNQDKLKFFASTRKITWGTRRNLTWFRGLNKRNQKCEWPMTNMIQVGIISTINVESSLLNSFLFNRNFYWMTPNRTKILKSKKNCKINKINSQKKYLKKKKQWSRSIIYKTKKKILFTLVQLKDAVFIKKKPKQKSVRIFHNLNSFQFFLFLFKFLVRKKSSLWLA